MPFAAPFEGSVWSPFIIELPRGSYSLRVITVGDLSQVFDFSILLAVGDLSLPSDNPDMCGAHMTEYLRKRVWEDGRQNVVANHDPSSTCGRWSGLEKSDCRRYR
jgi:hypothetical protein